MKNISALRKQLKVSSRATANILKCSRSSIMMIDRGSVNGGNIYNAYYRLIINFAYNQLNNVKNRTEYEELLYLIGETQQEFNEKSVKKPFRGGSNENDEVLINFVKNVSNDILEI